MQKTIIAIGGGELKSKETLKIDGYIADKAKASAVGRRACGLFIPTASHDSMPYFNSFRKTYTSVYDIKVDVALSVYGEMSFEKLEEKFHNADFIYIGGGDTVFMLRHWKESGMMGLIRDAYDRGVMICGLSAGAICWFEEMYTDSPLEGVSEKYSIFPGLGWIKGIISPHYNLRLLDFNEKIKYNNSVAVGLEDCSAIEIVDGEIVRSLSCGGNAYFLKREADAVISKQLIQPRIDL